MLAQRATPIPIAIAELVAAVLVPCIVIGKIFKLSFLRSMQAWLPTLLTLAVTLPLILFVLRPFFFEAFVTHTNSMAPTLLGDHWRGTCVDCGNPAYCSPERPGFERPGFEPWKAPQAICAANFHVTRPSDLGDRVFGPDRFLVAKYLDPRRWDLVLFASPEDPTAIFVKRLVGLPSEEITIRDGQVWADGKALTPPESIRGIEYLSKIGPWPEKLWGAPDNPAKLADDEYFVLGDFSPHARDSRLWREGAPGHNPYAVPRSHLRGVVTHIYWPPARWRTFR